ncbi:Bpu10I family restriction endonuclease [Aureibaculum luteum]|uniref:Bpu10I family restriction endonuclease n=1 Tax=Aureibaculum luteum TaxID=1548456 RepID=UPI0013006A94|nr:Bpu10I family restriction endonuclease [Aureibaculum luteum]
MATVYNHYKEFLENTKDLSILDDAGVKDLVSAFNDYRLAVLEPIESRKNSGQENIRSSMLEEFFCHLFIDVIKDSLEEVPDNLFLGKANSFVDLTFSPSSFKEIFLEPNPYFHSKDQDFVLGVSLGVTIQAEEKSYSQEIIIPVVAIECKTYIERNMLDSCSGTASRIKSAMPYCIYIVASEYMKLKDELPELSDINEIYILCKASNSDRLKNRKDGLNPHKIDEDLIIDLFNKIKGHLNSIWWQPSRALETGKIINRP